MESAFSGGQRVGHFEAAEDGVVAVDDCEVDVRQGADELSRFDFFDLELLGVFRDVAAGWL